MIARSNTKLETIAKIIIKMTKIEFPRIKDSIPLNASKNEIILFRK